MKLTIAHDDNVFQLDVTNEMELENLIAFCVAESGQSFDNLILVHNARPLDLMKKTLREYGIVDGDMLLVVNKNLLQQQQSQNQNQATSANSDAQTSTSLPGGPPNSSLPREITIDQALRVRDQFLANPSDLASLKQSNPLLADALNSGNLEEFRRVLNEQDKRRREEDLRRIRMLTADPFDVEAQQMIADEIKRQQIDSNMQDAMEYMPEAFGQVHMLYIKCKVNGITVDAFVDSGAQTTIMSKVCADRCNVTRLIDNRWSGIAQGVGTQKILGRIHMSDIQIENDFLPCSFSVLEQQSMDMLLGLDMLKRHQCVIDLKENVLKIGTTGTQTRFLSESEIQNKQALSSSSTS